VAGNFVFTASDPEAVICQLKALDPQRVAA
jgi:hypothetical protein